MTKKPKQTKTAGASRKATKKGAAAAGAREPATTATRTRDARIPAPGTVLKRTFKGKELRVTVLDDGFRFEGETFRSLTAVALRATGYPAISGPHFWKLGERAATTPKRASRKGAGTSATTPTTAPAETPTT